MKSLLLALAFFTASFGLQAAGKVDFLEVQNSMVSFSTTQEKTATGPICVGIDNANIWTLSLVSPSDRANYAMLLTALSTGILINVESAGDCAYMQGAERAKRVWFAK
jgi:hypothetical protein